MNAQQLAACQRLHDKIATDAAIKVARVKCDKCGRTQTVDGGRCLALGWPRCCGYTMSLLPRKI
jgi:hypothetical protein